MEQRAGPPGREHYEDTPAFRLIEEDDLHYDEPEPTPEPAGNIFEMFDQGREA